MNGLRRAALLSFTFTSLFTGCASGHLDDEAVDSAADAIVVDNALIPNALIPNALIPNALIPNALIPNGLDSGLLAVIGDPGEAGVLSRVFVEYAVSCAFTPSQSFRFAWTDTSGTHHQETYVGLVGLAPGWATGPLDLEGQRLVSACLAARTNYYGVTVLVSMRSGAPPLDTMTPPSELAAYPHVEGAFWGNLFTRAPELYACFDLADVRIDWEDQRDCATGHLERDGRIVPCGPITLTGPCALSCERLDGAGQYYPRCHADGTDPHHMMTPDVITTALP